MRSWEPGVFERIYAESGDPWRYRDSPYEAAKRHATLAALGRQRYRTGFEVGCSIGILTRGLARRCSRLLAVDCADAALATARQSCRGLPHVRFHQAVLPRDWPRGQRFDLIIYSEVLYYMGAPDLARLARRSAASLLPGGEVVLVNWTGATDSPLTGARAAEGFARASQLRRACVRRFGSYRIDRLIAQT
jgi:2-polyprenyl-3-methyl-5-hydroxy-6-metoxy-1,4-benzoquinol methylase